MYAVLGVDDEITLPLSVRLCVLVDTCGTETLLRTRIFLYRHIYDDEVG
jgi:hypothetical protein